MSNAQSSVPRFVNQQQHFAKPNIYLPVQMSSGDVGWTSQRKTVGEVFREENSSSETASRLSHRDSKKILMRPPKIEDDLEIMGFVDITRSEKGIAGSDFLNPNVAFLGSTRGNESDASLEFTLCHNRQLRKKSEAVPDPGVKGFGPSNMPLTGHSLRPEVRYTIGNTYMGDFPFYSSTEKSDSGTVSLSDIKAHRSSLAMYKTMQERSTTPIVSRKSMAMRSFDPGEASVPCGPQTEESPPSWDKSETFLNLSREPVEISFVPKDIYTGLDTSRKVVQLVLSSMENLPRFYLDQNEYSFYLQFIQFPLKNSLMEQRFTDLVGPFLSESSSNGLTVRCELQNCLVELPYIPGYQLRAEVIQKSNDRIETIGKIKISISVDHIEESSFIESRSFPIEGLGSLKGSLETVVYFRVNSEVPENLDASINSPGQNTRANRNPNSKIRQKNESILWKWMSELFFDAKPDQKGGKKSQTQFMDKPLSVFCMDLPDKFCGAS